MNRKGQGWLYLIFVLGIISITLGFLIHKLDNLGYKQGQIDYANGIIKYELKEQPDKTVAWVERSK